MSHGAAPITGIVGTTISGTAPSAATGTTVNSADLNDALQAVCNDMATVASGNCTIAGNKTFSGACEFTGTTTIFDNGINVPTTAVTTSIAAGGIAIGKSGGTITVPSGCSLAGTWSWNSSSVVKVLGRSALKRTRVAIADGDKKVSVTTGTGVNYSGDRFTLPGTTAAKRVITLDSTVNVPNDGETLTFLCQPVGLTISSGIAFEFKSDAAALIARVYWDTSNVSTQTGADNFWVTFEAVGGAWVLAENSGSTGDATNTHWVGVRIS